MPNNDYHFITYWRIPGTVKEVTDILADAEGLQYWWPSVYLDVKVLDPGDANGIGKVVDLYTKGWLPYTLRWQFCVTEASDSSFTLAASGDFEGQGIWTFKQDGDYVNVIYDWKINAEKPLLKLFSLILKPVFAANHHWAMRKGEESLLLELARRRALTPDEYARIPLPPPTSNPAIFYGGVGLFLVALFIIYRLFREMF
jgi:hypothetical protein